jgi:phosphate transport system substrate-binding protein
MNAKFAFYTFAIASFFLISCNSNSGKKLSTPTSGKERIVCDETFKPIIEDEINVFNSLYDQATINSVYQTENSAINSLLKDSTHLAIVTRRLTDAEKKHFESKQLMPREILVAYDAIAIIEHPSNNDSMLTMSQLGDIFTGKITTWDQLNRKNNHKKIKIIFDNPNSSTISYVTNKITKNVPIKNAVAALTNKEVIENVSQEENSIGIIGVNWISDRDDTTCMNFLKTIRVVALSNENVATYSNSYKPFQGYIATGEYPIRRELLCLLTEPHTGLCSGFVSFLTSDRGQRIILKSGILPATQTLRLVEVNSKNNNQH